VEVVAALLAVLVEQVPPDRQDKVTMVVVAILVTLLVVVVPVVMELIMLAVEPDVQAG